MSIRGYTTNFVSLLPHFLVPIKTMIILRTLGIRTLVLVDEQNQPSGILTRKDLMGFAVEEKLQKSISRRESHFDGPAPSPVTNGLNSNSANSFTEPASYKVVWFEVRRCNLHLNGHRIQNASIWTDSWTTFQTLLSFWQYHRNLLEYLIKRIWDKWGKSHLYIFSENR